MQNSTPNVRIHGFFPYDRGAKSRWLLTELNVSFETRWLDVDAGELDSPEYHKLNPMGRVPAMELDGRLYLESTGICATLADRFPGLAPTLTSPDRAEYQQWMYFSTSTLDVFTTAIMIIEDIPAGELHTAKLDRLLEHVDDAFGALERTLSKNDYLVGNRFSAADICVSYGLTWMQLWPEFGAAFAKYPSIARYLARLGARPAAIESKALTVPN